MSYKINKIPKDFITTKFLNEIFDEICLPDELRVYILEIIGIKYCFQNSLIKSYVLEKYSDYANYLYNNMSKSIDLEYYLMDFYNQNYTHIDYFHTYAWSRLRPEFEKHINRSDEFDKIFYNYHKKNNTLIHKIFSQEDKYGLDYIYSILKILHNEEIIGNNHNFIKAIINIYSVPTFKKVYILPWHINIVKLKQEIIDFNFDEYSCAKFELKKLFPLFEKIKNDKRGKFRISRILEKKSINYQK